MRFIALKLVCLAALASCAQAPSTPPLEAAKAEQAPAAEEPSDRGTDDESAYLSQARAVSESLKLYSVASISDKKLLELGGGVCDLFEGYAEQGLSQDAVLNDLMIGADSRESEQLMTVVAPAASSYLCPELSD